MTDSIHAERRRALIKGWNICRARRDPNEFAEFAFADPHGRPLEQAEVHRDLQLFLGRQNRALVELPRDHGKSVQLCVRVLWELGRRPELRVKLVCATEAVAAERGRFLRRAIEQNQRLHMVFPGLRPASPWTDTRFSVVRPAEVIGPSVTAVGFGAALTGTRADLLVCDDVVDVRAVHSYADRERVKVFFRENLVNLLEPDGRLWDAFTPWHRDDLNAELKRNGAYGLFRRAVGDDLTPVWPEKWPRERLEERRREIGATAFARAYRLVCAADEQLAIRPEWLRYWSGSPGYERIILAVDPAVSTKHTADASALVILGESEHRQIHCLEALARRVNAPDLVELIATVDRRWNPGTIVFESNAAFAGMAELMRRQQTFGGKMLSLTQWKSKEARVQAFSVSVENGTFRLKGEGGAVAPEQMALYDEMTTFPVGEHDDLLDAAATGTMYLLSCPMPRVRG